MRTLKLITRFYTDIFVVNFLITLSCVYLIRYFGANAWEIVIPLFWYKAISVAAVFYTTVYYHKKELYYYQNLGVSATLLVIATSAVELLLWVAFIIIQFKISIPGYVFNLLVVGVLSIFLYLHTR
jgi:hypothetical protein